MHTILCVGVHSLLSGHTPTPKMMEYILSKNMSTGSEYSRLEMCNEDAQNSSPLTCCADLRYITRLRYSEHPLSLCNRSTHQTLIHSNCDPIIPSIIDATAQPLNNNKNTPNSARLC